MSDPRTITADAFEILVTRELRRAGIEPVGWRRQTVLGSAAEFSFSLIGRLQAYGHKWSALIECRNRSAPIQQSDINVVRKRADDARATSALLCTTAPVGIDAVERARELAMPLLRVVDAQGALMQAGTIQPGQLPAWVPEFALQIVTADAAGQHARLLEADQPELILQELRVNGSS